MTRKTKTLPASTEQKVSAERVKAYIRTRFNPIRNLTPELLAQYLDSFDAGYLKQAALLWNAIENRDDTLKSVAPKRKKAVARNGWDIITVDTKDDSQAAEADRQKEVLESFWNNISVTNAIDENETGELSLLVRQMLDAVGKRYAVHEIVWKPGLDLSAEFRFAPIWFFENTTGRLRYLVNDASLYGEDMEAGKWMVTVGDGLMYACSIAYIYKNLSLKDWIIYSERHGMPGIHGKTSSQKDSAEWTDLADAVENFAADWAVVTNDGATIEKIDLSTAGQLPYPPLVERMSRAMAAIWRGADLSTISQGTQGVGASLQGDETILLEQDDAEMISETLRRNVERRVLKYYFGEDVVPLAYIQIKTSKKQNVEQDLKTDEALHRMGAPIPVKPLLERYGRSMPDQDDQLLTAPAPAPVAPIVNSAQPADAGSTSPERSGLRADPGATTRTAPSSKPDLKSEISNLKSIASALAADLAPVRERLEYILTLDDPDFQRAALLNFQRDLPKILSQAADLKSAAALETALSAALLNGLTDQSVNPVNQVNPPEAS